MFNKDDLINKIICGDSLEVLKKFPDNFIDMTICSPPYYNLRNYGVEGQIGNESSFNEYLDKLIAIFKEVKRVTKDSGSIWVNIGDTYNSSGSSARPGGFQKTRGRKDVEGTCIKKEVSNELGEKSLCQIPNRFALRMTDELDLILRNEIIWHKPVCMPSSAKDRFTVDFEKLFFFTKNSQYYFETQYESLKKSSIKRAEYGLMQSENEGAKNNAFNVQTMKMGERFVNPKGRIKRSVWTINPAVNKEKGCDEHFAIFPEELVVSPILACCPLEICSKCGKIKTAVYKTHNPGGIFGIKGLPNVTEGNCNREMINKTGTVFSTSKFSGYDMCDCNVEFVPGLVLDPFMGTGTTALVCKKYKRNYLGIEINPKYIQFAQNKLRNITKHEDILMPNETNLLNELFYEC